MAGNEHAIGCDLAEVNVTDELEGRPKRVFNAQIESTAFIQLTQELAKSPGEFFQKLVETARQLTGADSTGISLLAPEQGRFVWVAIAGTLRPYLGGGTPADFGPCGTVLEKNQAMVLTHPERHYLYLAPLNLSLEEVLLVPFRASGKAVGTIWAVIQNVNQKFDGEDRRRMQALTEFASSAYVTLANAGAIEPLLKKSAEHK